MMNVLDILTKIRKLTASGDWNLQEIEKDIFQLFRKGDDKTYCPFTSIWIDQGNVITDEIDTAQIAKELGVQKSVFQMVDGGFKGEIGDPGYSAVRASLRRIVRGESLETEANYDKAA